MNIFSSIETQVIGWIVAGILTWIALKIPGIKLLFENDRWLGAVIAAVIASGLFFSVSQWLLDRRFADLGNWGGSQDAHASGSYVLRCPEGNYVVGISYEMKSGGSSGALKGISAVCRPLKINH